MKKKIKRIKKIFQVNSLQLCKISYHQELTQVDLWICKLSRNQVFKTKIKKKIIYKLGLKKIKNNNNLLNRKILKSGKKKAMTAAGMTMPSLGSIANLENVRIFDRDSAF